MEDLPARSRLSRLRVVWAVIESNMPGMFLVVTEAKVRLRPLTIP